MEKGLLTAGDCALDFDNTLIDVDSLAFIFWKEKFFLQPQIIFWGAAAAAARIFLSYSRQEPIRRRFKHKFCAYLEMNKERILRVYPEIFSKRLNERLIALVAGRYEKIFVVSSSWKPLIEAVPAPRRLSWPVLGTDHSQNLQDFFLCWHKNKPEVLRRFGVFDFDAYTDSLEDAPLLEAARRGFLVKKDSITLWRN